MGRVFYGLGLVLGTLLVLGSMVAVLFAAVGIMAAAGTFGAIALTAMLAYLFLQALRDMGLAFLRWMADRRAEWRNRNAFIYCQQCDQVTRGVTTCPSCRKDAYQACTGCWTYHRGVMCPRCAPVKGNDTGKGQTVA